MPGWAMSELVGAVPTCAVRSSSWSWRMPAPCLPSSPRPLALGVAPLPVALLLVWGVVAAVLLEVALLAAGVDLGGDDGAVVDQLVQFTLEPVVGLLGEPGHLRLRHGHHSSSLSGSLRPRTSAREGPSAR